MLTKTQVKIMKFFVAHITGKFSINGIAKLINMNVSLAHRAIIPLIKDHKLLCLDKQNFLSLDYNAHSDVFAYIEYLRREHCLNKISNKLIKNFKEEILEKLKDEYFIIILFGSAVEKKNPSDFDILFIFEDHEKVKKREKAVELIALNYSEKFDINVLAVESIYEMAAKRNQKNILNELLNKHIVLYGAENFYRLLKNARQ